MLLLTSLYIPAVQDFALNKALAGINNGDGKMHVEVERFRLYPPLHITVEGVTVTEDADTMVHVGNADVKVSLLHLFKGELGISQIALDNVSYNMGNTDSLMNMHATLGSVRLDDAAINSFSKSVDLKQFTINKSRLTLGLRTDTVAKADDPQSEPLPWSININKINIDSLTFAMGMEGTIDSLGVSLPQVLIDNTNVNLAIQTVAIGSVGVNNMDATYLTPATTAPSAPKEPGDTVNAAPASAPWCINIDHIAINAEQALYATAGAVPIPGLDPDYIKVTKVNIAIDSLLSCGSDLRVPIKEISAHERCGLDLSLNGLFAMETDSITVRDLSLTTPQSAITLNATMGLPGSLPMPLLVNADGSLSPTDIATAFPALAPMMAGIPRSSLLNIGIDITGSDGLYHITDISAQLPRCFDIAANGSITATTDFYHMNGRLNINGHIANNQWVKPALKATNLDNTLAVQPLAMHGQVDINNGTATGRLAAVSAAGKLALDADWKARPEKYDISLTTSQFPLNSFMPLLDVSSITADVAVHGKGYSPFSPATTAQADVKIHNIKYLDKDYTNVALQAELAEGNATLSAASSNRDANFTLNAHGNLTPTPYDWTFDADIIRLDLQAIGLTDSLMNGAVAMNGTLSYNPDNQSEIKTNVDITKLTWHMSQANISTTDLILTFLANDTLTAAAVNNHDLEITLNSSMPLDSISTRLGSLPAVVDSVIARRRLDIDSIQHTLPPFNFNLKAGQNNIINNYLGNLDMGFTKLKMKLSNDTLINFDTKLMNFNSGETVIDTITARINQANNTLQYNLHVGNRPGTLDQWAQVTALGGIGGNRSALLLNQQNIEGKTGFRFGFIVRTAPEGVDIRVVPKHPIIGYKTWTVNDSNFIAINTKHRHFDADLAMQSAESSIHIFTDNVNHTDSLQEDLILNINNIKLDEWISFNPFAPPVTGSLSSNMKFSLDESSINGDGTISLTNLNYNRQRVGSFDLGVGLQTNKNGTTRASATLMVDSIKTITAEGNLNDSTALNPFLLDFKMIHFPLNVLNPFLPKDMARMSGTLNGTMDITGTLTEPIFNGYLDFDSTTLTIPMFGTSYKFSDNKIPMDSNIVKFNNFFIMGANDSPLSVNGTVDARHLTNILIDLKANANNLQIVKSNKKRGIQVYGKAFIDLDATARGTMSRLNVNANLSVLENTNVTYIVTSATDNLSSRSNTDIVKFVNFADTTAIENADSIMPQSMTMSVNATLNIRQGSTIGVDLSTDGKNRAQLQSAGTLNYVMNYMGDSRLTGRLNINGGYVRYTPPFMSEKLFDFTEGNYISFNGDIMNPYLNIKAVDVLKANVQNEGQNSRLINFDVILSITNSLSNLNVAFDLETNDDITVANELQSMTPEQRANQAMNLLLYNMYTGPGTKASASLNGNPLFAFLESKVNSWAANNIKGVDLSFGIDQYDRTVNGASSLTTSYSYKVSKSLFNDRFKISVGGNYASDSDPDQNLEQNLINDISFEYDLTPSGSMYIRVFRHTGYESILEGEITQTGVGFVYKRKLRKLNDLFKPFRRRPKTINTQTTTTQ